MNETKLEKVSELLYHEPEVALVGWTV